MSTIRALTSVQRKIIKDHAARILPPWRSRYVCKVALRLRGLVPIQNATLASICRRTLVGLPGCRRLS
jgi:hypothetical protein